MDAFYASIEQRDHPELRGKPVVVGGQPDRRGVVATASYEARKFGIHSAMPSRRAKQLCPEAIFVRPRFDVYKKVSESIREIFARYTDLIEPLSLDEAYLDVTTDKQGIGSAIEIARRIKNAIREELHLTASAGVSINKFVAKIASDANKPDGLTFVGPSRVERFIEMLPVEKFHGVGKVTAARMHSLGIRTGADLRKFTEEELVDHFGKSGFFFYQIARGIDERPVQPYRETKSVGAEDTFEKDLADMEDIFPEIDKIAMHVHERLRKRALAGRTITLKIKYYDFRIVTRRHTSDEFFDDFNTISSVAKALAVREAPARPVRLIGITISNFREPATGSRDQGATRQLDLF